MFSHNGGIYYYDYFPNEWGIETDSFALFYWIWYEYLKCYDTVTAIQEGVRHVVGSYACWLWNFNDRATYLFRNHSYPTVTVYNRDRTSEGKYVLFGSDADAIYDALRTTKAKVYNIRPNKIYKVVDGDIEQVGAFRPRRIPYYWEWNLKNKVSLRCAVYIKKPMG